MFSREIAKGAIVQPIAQRGSETQVPLTKIPFHGMVTGVISRYLDPRSAHVANRSNPNSSSYQHPPAVGLPQIPDRTAVRLLQQTVLTMLNDLMELALSYEQYNLKR